MPQYEYQPIYKWFWNNSNDPENIINWVPFDDNVNNVIEDNYIKYKAGDTRLQSV